MDFRMLGPVEVGIGGEAIEPGPAKQRCVLAALAVQAGRPVPAALLVGRVWGADPPADARAALYSYITRLRGIGVPIPRTDKGYLLDTVPDRVDLHRFTHASLDRALREWRGEPLAGLAGDWVSGLRLDLHRQRIAKLAAWADTALAEGKAAEVVQRIGAAVDEYPQAEQLVGALLRGLHAEGRTAEALERYEATRLRLRAEHGTLPGEELRELHARLLRGRGTPPARPAQLPAARRGFVGRAEQLRELDATGARVVVISGPPGVGKTALALHWAHRAAHRFPDGQLHADLGRRADVIQPFLRALGVCQETAAERYRSLLRGRRMLVLLDDVAEESQVLPLLPGGLVVITSRSQLDGLPAARRIALRPLSQVESLGLLADRLGRKAITDDPAGAAALAEVCGGLPLTLRIAAASLLDRHGCGLADYARELRTGFADLISQYAGDRAG